MNEEKVTTPDPATYSAADALRDVQADPGDEQKPDETANDQEGVVESEETEVEAEKEPETDDDLVEFLQTASPEAIQKRASEIAKGVRKSLDRAKKSETDVLPMMALARDLADPEKAADALAWIVKAAEETTKLPKEVILAKLGIQAKSQNTGPELSEADIEKWEELGFDSKNEAVLKLELQALRKEREADRSEFKAFMDSQKHAQAELETSRKAEDWLTGNLPKIQREMETRYSGLKLTKDEVRQALGGKTPVGFSDAVATVKARYVDKIADHLRSVLDGPAPRREMIAGRTGSAAHTFPSDPLSFRAADAIRLVRDGG